MDILHQQFRQRLPRYGIDPDLLDKSGILLDSSPSVFSTEEGEAFQLKTLSIVNISVGGIKLTVVNPDELELSGLGVKLDFAAPSRQRVYKLKGRVTWSEHLTNGNSWIGVELLPRPDVLELFTDLTGRQP